MQLHYHMSWINRLCQYLELDILLVRCLLNLERLLVNRLVSDISNPCVTQTIYQQFPNSGIMRSIGCQTDFPFTDQTVYRNLGVLTSSSNPSTSTAIPSSSTQQSPQLSTTSAIDPVTKPSSGTPQAGSKAWIAGVVIGPLALVVIAGMFFYIRKLRRRPAESAANEEPKYATVPVEIYTAPRNTPPVELA
jgi:hypothetical protein